MTKIIFWSSFTFIFYSYLGYPILLLALSIFRKRKVVRGDITPPVSFVVAAYNEQQRIEGKIKNILEQDYPKEKLEIIIASDSSTDRTDEIVSSYRTAGVRLVRAPERKGKENAQKFAVDAASGGIIIFSDVATKLDPDGVRKIIQNFNDPCVGCVSSVDTFINRAGKISGESAYVRYEMRLRMLESQVNSLVGLSGSFFAARRELCYPWAVDLQSDFNTLINSVKRGYRGVSDTQSIGYYQDISDGKKEFSRKVRTIVRGIRVLMNSLPMLNPFKYGLFSLQLISHKLCRWLVPFALLILLLSNVFLATKVQHYIYILVLQAGFYVMAALGYWTSSNRKVLKIPLFFIMVNLSIIIAWYKYLRREDFIKWEPSAR